MRRIAGKSALLVFGATYVAAAALYVASAARAPAGGDWGDFVAAASVLGIAHPTGYPVYLQILALPLSVLPAAWAAAAADVANALAVALAPALLAWGAYRVGRGNGRDDAGLAAFAVLAGVLFAGAPSLWLEATSVEVYGAAFALLLGALLILDLTHRGDGRPYIAAAFLGGLGAGVHLTAFAYVLVLLAVWGAARRPPVRVVWLAAACWALGLSAALFLPIRAVAAPPLTWTWTGISDLRTFVIHATGRQFSYNFRAPTWLLATLRLRELFAAVWRSGGPFVFLAPLGLWLLWRRARAAAAAVVAVLVLNTAFLLCYDIPDLASYQLPFVGLAFACAACGAAALFRAAGGKLRVAVTAVAAAAVAFSLAREWPRQRRDPEFISYYGRQIVLPVGYRAVYVSGTTTSNFLYWFRQYTLRQRPDVELYNINDERFDIDKLSALIWREVGARPVFVDYFFLYQTHQRRAFCRRGRPAGFILGLADRETGPEEAWPLDAEVLARAGAFATARRYRKGDPDQGLNLAVSVWEYHGLFYEYRGDPGRTAYYLERAAAFDVDSSVPYINLARFYFDQGRYEEARRAAHKAVAIGGEEYMSYMAYAYLAMADQAEGDLDAALKHARVAVALKPHDGKTHRLVAAIYLERGERERAKRELENTLECGYNDPDVVLLLAAMYRREGRDDEAFKLLAENVHEYNDVRLMNAYALALIARGRYVEAKAELVRAARIAPHSAEVRANLARLEAMGW